MTERWMSINKFMDSISELTKDATCVSVFFDDWNENKYNWSIKPIGYNLIINNKATVLSFYDVHKMIPEMEFIQFKADGRKRMKELGNQKKLFKLIIQTEEKEYKTFKYHVSVVREAKQEIYPKMLKKYEEERKKYLDELADNAFEKNNEVLLEMMENIEDAF